MIYLSYLILNYFILITSSLNNILINAYTCWRSRPNHLIFSPSFNVEKPKNLRIYIDNIMSNSLFVNSLNFSSLHYIVIGFYNVD